MKTLVTIVALVALWQPALAFCPQDNRGAGANQGAPDTCLSPTPPPPVQTQQRPPASNVPFTPNYQLMQQGQPGTNAPGGPGNYPPGAPGNYPPPR